MAVTTLFERNDFTSHGGLNLSWKINCDALTDDDIETLAFVISKHVKFSSVIGIPNGGLRLATALEKYATDNSGQGISHYTRMTLIVDDVLTTGTSMEQARKKILGPTRGIVIFARGDCPVWVTPIFRLTHSVGAIE
jgi:hypoxanthine phosphoribosyltransferase